MSYRALLFCADEKTAPVVARILSELEFAVESCREPFAAVKLLAADHFDALVVDCDDEQNAALLLKSARNSGLNHSSLAVALVEGQAGIARAFRLGANLVLAKPINIEQSKGTLRVARGLLRKAEAAKPAAAAAASPAAILPPSATAADSLFAPAAVEAASNLTLASVPGKMVETFSPVANVPVATATVSNAPVGNAPVATAPLKLEVEADPVPPLGAEEAALLESLPAPLAPQPAVASAGAKGYAWQPASKSLPEPAPAPAAPPSFPVLAKTSGLSPAIDPSLPSPASENRPEASTQKTGGLEARGLFSGQNAATAAAPAKEIPTPVLDLYETKPLPPPTRVAGAPASRKDSKKAGDRKSAARSPKSSARSRAGSASNAFSPDEEEAAPAPEESNTKNLIIAAVLVLGLAASGYYAWPRLQPALESLPIVQKYFGAPQSEVSPPLSPAVPAAAPAPASAAPSAAGPGQPSSAPASGPTEPQARPEESGRAGGSVEPDPAASAAASSSASAAAAVPGPRVAITHPAAGRASKPLVVKDDRNQSSALKKGAAQPAAPAPLEIASSSGDQAIAGIVGTMAGAHPVLKPINVSQGVSNGLLVKQVPPLYPTLALQMRVAGSVELEANISKDGSTANVQVLKGDPLLRQAAVNAVRQWKYKPYRLDGQPVEIVTQVTVNFVLPQ